MKAFGIFLVGALLAIAGLTWAMIQLGIPTSWVVIVDLIVFGISVASGAGLIKPWADTTSVNVQKD
ncbi:hypothetical protein ABWI01_12080 [Oceanicaulis alexandrii]|uniref:hypothetical protein n=1 Tax=Oceanicaulis TaxID=153232 RepID=UPI0035D12F57